MGLFDKNKFESSSQEYETPDYIFEKLDNEFQFDIDLCASKENTKCKQYYSEENSCLDKEWKGVGFMNPPYKNVKQFVQKAFNERNNSITVCLIPAKTNTKWWHNFCMNAEVRFICGRPKFKGCVHGLPFPLAIVIFGSNDIGKLKSFYID